MKGISIDNYNFKKNRMKKMSRVTKIKHNYENGIVILKH